MSSQIFCGGILAYVASLLMSVAHSIIKKLNLNAVDALLPQQALQTLLMLFMIYVHNYRQTRSQNNNYTPIPNSKENSDEKGDKISIWINSVDSGMNIHKIRSILIFQGICGPVSTLCGYVSLTMMPIGDATAIVYSAPLSTMIIAFFCLGQRLRLYKISAGICIAIGVSLVAQPSFLSPTQEKTITENSTQSINNRSFHSTVHESYYDGKYAFGVSMAIMASLFRGCQVVAKRYLYSNKSTSSPMLTPLYSGLLGILIAITGAQFMYGQKLLSKDIGLIDVYSWTGIISSATMGTLAALAQSKSLQLIDPVFEQCIRASGPINAYIFQIALFHESLNLMCVIGAGTIVIAILAIPWEDYVISKIPDGMLKEIL